MANKNKQKLTVFRRILAVFLLLTTIATAGLYWYQNQNYASPVHQAIRKVLHPATKAKQVVNTQPIIDKIMTQDATQDHLTRLGVVSIPKVGVYLPIYNDAYSSRALDLGANTANKDGSTPTMGTGNYTLAAHNWNNGRTGFSALQKVINQNAPYLVNGKTAGSDWLNGTKLYLANNDGIFVYEIVGQKTIDQNDTSVLNQDLTVDGQPQVTVITCLFPSTNYRIITTAKLDHKIAWSNASDDDIRQVDPNQNTANVKP